MKNKSKGKNDNVSNADKINYKRFDLETILSIILELFLLPKLAEIKLKRFCICRGFFNLFINNIAVNIGIGGDLPLVGYLRDILRNTTALEIKTLHLIQHIISNNKPPLDIWQTTCGIAA